MKTKYTIEQRKQLAKQYFSGESVSSICLQTGIPRSTFYTWIKKYKIAGTASGLEVSLVDFSRQIKRIQKLENMIDVLQAVNCTVTSPLQVRLNELERLYGQYSVHVLCESLNVARGTFYNHMYRNKKGDNVYRARREKLSEQIKEIFDNSKQIYGARKIRAVLRSRGVRTSDKMVAELMGQMNLRSIRSETKRQYKRRILNETKRDALKMNFSANEPNQVWAGDITYFKLCGTTRYICAIIDLYSRKIVAYKVFQKQSTQLVTSTFKIAYESRKPSDGLIFHSDRGTQYCSFAFRRLLKVLNVSQSFSPKAKPYHNAAMESFFSNLKNEELYRINYRSIKEFQQSVKEYMERYNNERPHIALRYKTPNAYEQEFFDSLNKD